MASSCWCSTTFTAVTTTTRRYSFTSTNDPSSNGTLKEYNSTDKLPLLYTSISAKKKNNTDNKKLKKLRKWETQKSKNTFSYPQSKPTPLLIHQQPYPQTKIQALEQVLNDLEASLEKGILIDTEIYASLLETCYRFRSIHHGIRLHRLIPPTLVHKNVGISSKLVRLYASFGYMDDAHDLFDQMTKRDLYAFPWNSLISGYAELGLYDDAIALYFQMVEEGVEPDLFTFPRVLKVCGGIGLVQVGEEVHRHVVRSGFGDDVFVLNALVDMYSKCGDIVKARKVFNKMPLRDSVSWNSMLTAYVRHGVEHMVIGGLTIMAIENFNNDPDVSGNLEEYSSSGILALIYKSIFGNANRGSLTKLGLLAFLTQMFTSTFMFLYLGETFSPVQLVGAIITLAAVYIVNFRKNYSVFRWFFQPNPTSQELKLGMLSYLTL
ncbi:hypothetical protein TSUD_124150 [Trifolium subterraneum]|uniref:Uncharacterized protein n=1 Tax=Trifolium subterraneum TaxID=3900 RepID=A0A2Z6LLX9_TRISU|nr:hypothetical protein TSUD_124150 [Trifolium subterraneum]